LTLSMSKKPDDKTLHTYVRADIYSSKPNTRVGMRRVGAGFCGEL
jgi:hypothetical protein